MKLGQNSMCSYIDKHRWIYYVVVIVDLDLYLHVADKQSHKIMIQNNDIKIFMLGLA